MAVVQFDDPEGVLDGAAPRAVGEEAGEPVRDARRRQQGDGGGEFDVRVQQAVVRRQQVGAVVRVQVGDPDAVEPAEGVSFGSGRL